MSYAKRALLMLRQQGPMPLARAAFRHFVLLRWRGVVFRDDPSTARPRLAWPEGYRFQLWDSVRDIAPAQRAALEKSCGTGFLLSLEGEDGVYAVWRGDEAVAYGAVFRRSPQRDVLGLPDSAVLIGGCLTLPAHRRKGLYRLALNETARLLRPRHAGAIFVEARPENRASIGGIRAAGFVERGTVQSAVWFGALVHREGRWHRLRRESHV